MKLPPMMHTLQYREACPRFEPFCKSGVRHLEGFFSIDKDVGLTAEWGQLATRYGRDLGNPPIDRPGVLWNSHG